MYQTMPRVVGRKSPSPYNAPSMHNTLSSPYSPYRDMEVFRSAAGADSPLPEKLE